MSGSKDDMVFAEDHGKLPWLCDDCASKGMTRAGIFALVNECKACKEPKCPHCYSDDSGVCDMCAGKMGGQDAAE